MEPNGIDMGDYVERYRGFHVVEGSRAGSGSASASSRVSGSAAQTSMTASAPAAASPMKLTVLPNRSATNPAASVLSVAPMPAVRPNNPIQRL